jgi:rhamnogalacturonyl hydrolase YesR
VPKGRSYREASATALIACGLLYGARVGILDESCRVAGLRAFDALEASITEDKKGISLPAISAPTIPIPGAPLVGYLLTPTGKNLTYGLAAMFFAALENGKLRMENGELR